MTEPTEPNRELQVSSPRPALREVSGDTTRTSACEDSTVPLLLSRLKQEPVSSLNRKRKVAHNLPHDGKRRKPPCYSSEPKRVTPAQRLREFPDQKLVVSAGKLFCTACKEDVALKSNIELHIKSDKHTRGKEKLACKEKREHDIVKALGAYDEEVHPVGETLPADQRIFRIKVVSTFLKAGVPLNKIDIFRDVLEEGSYRLAGRRPMSDLVPFIHSEEKQRIREEISGKDVAVIFDGTSRLGKAVVVVLRFVDSDWSPQQRLVRLQLLAKTMCGDEIARELVSILSTELSIPGSNVLAL